MGLSPPTRGSRGASTPRRGEQRSIPAHTGKPRAYSITSSYVRVYPRPHGEADWGPPTPRSNIGLSPPTRGSRRLEVRQPVGLGSIPAHTGKPPWPPAGGSRRKVYPRPHGEALMVLLVMGSISGLSPPTRGSLLFDGIGANLLGSIPAHTGKPLAARLSAQSSAVYPRPHGEAADRDRRECHASGLSPPTRGSHAGWRRQQDQLGSIPAHTGKPSTCRRRSGSAAVYPRPHGEASIRVSSQLCSGGLSPPTRGSLALLLLDLPLDRSIPAHTGKPWSA